MRGDDVWHALAEVLFVDHVFVGVLLNLCVFLCKGLIICNYVGSLVYGRTHPTHIIN